MIGFSRLDFSVGQGLRGWVRLSVGVALRGVREAMAMPSKVEMPELPWQTQKNEEAPEKWVSQNKYAIRGQKSQQRCVSYEIPEDTPFPEAMNNPLGEACSLGPLKMMAGQCC